MAQPTIKTVTGVAASAPVPLNYQSGAPFNVSLWVDVGAGCTYSIQVTCEPLTAVPTFWIDHSSATALTVDCAVSLAFPATAARLNQTAGAAATIFTVIQQGIT